MRLDHALPVLARLGWQASLLFATGWVGACDGATEPVAFGDASAPVRMQATTPTDLEGTVGTSVKRAPGVRVTDADNRPVEGLTIAFVVEGVDSVIADATDRTDARGFATLGTWTLDRKAGPQRVTAYAEDLTPVVFAATAVAGPPRRIRPREGNGQSARPGTMLPVPLSVRVTDSYDNPVAGVTIVFTVASGGGSLEGDAGLTDADGIAETGVWTLGPVAGAQWVRAQAADAHLLLVAYAGAPPPSCTGTTGCGKIAFVSARDGNPEIYSVNADGSGLTRLTNDPSDDGDPVWSPDGQRIAFVSNRSGDYEIYVMNADGSDVVRRTFSANHSQEPSWSPDGTLLAYSRLSDGSMNLWIVGADAGGPEPALLFGTPGWDVRPAWSPDGTRLALVSDWAAYDFVEDIYLINADGSGFEQLTGDIFYHVDYPSWSPDGSLMAVTIKKDPGGMGEYVTSIGLMNADGTALHPLVSEAAGKGAWSPDGQMIAYTSGVGDVRHILWVRVDGGDSGVIVSDGWSPDWR